MISPRRTCLHRVPDLRAFQAVIARLALDGDLPLLRSTLVIVPSAGAGAQLRATLERHVARDGRRRAIVLPVIATREGLYDELHARLPDPPALVSQFEREVLLRVAAREAVAAGCEPPFRLRPGLIAEILEFYDALARQDRTIEAFERNTIDALAPTASVDRGADRLLRQTRFLTATFRAFEARLAARGLVDEHVLRRLLRETTPGRPLRRVIVTVADRAADVAGLWLSDFDLLARLPGLEAIDVVATDLVLESGFQQRLQDLLPEAEAMRAGEASPRPALLVPGDEPSRAYFVSRDREEELAAAARALKAAHAGGVDEAPSAGRTAVVFQRPLPYLYLARQVFASAGVPYEAQDALPLAAEPYAAAVDLVFEFVGSGFTRGATIALMRSPHFRFEHDGHPLGPEDVDALDRALYEVRYLGGRDRLARLAGEWRGDGSPAGRSGARADQIFRRAGAAATAAAEAAEALAVVEAGGAPAAQIEAMLDFLRAHERPADTGDHARHLRARAAILGAMRELARAYAARDREPCRFSEVAGTIRRWIEGQTFAPPAGAAGVSLVDAQAARYGDFDEVRIVGLVEGEWPPPARRSIFYPSALLAPLGFPKETDRAAGSRAMFGDLLGLPRERLLLSTFVLEEDAVVKPSWLLDEIDARLPRARWTPASVGRIFVEEALSREPVVPAAVAGEAAEWLRLRAGRRPIEEPRFHGFAGAGPADGCAVSAIERYIDCPFRYFAERVLRLEQAREEEAALTPQERGRFIHEVFQAFFAEWDRAGRGAITVENLAFARELFARVVDQAIERLPEAERALERVRLIGSAAAQGLGDRVLRFEAERRVEVLERLLEYKLDGDADVTGGGVTRRVRLRGTADRIDLLADGTLRLLDYKSGRPPRGARAIQLPIYGVTAEQRLNGYRGRAWTLGEAGYVSFALRDPFVSMVPRGADRAAVLAEGQRRFLDALDGIERGSFPPRPSDVILCDFCPYPIVCRKDYVGDQ
jgi:RecB family exonuclease